VAIARFLLDKFHPMKHIERPFERPLCWCGIRHFEIGDLHFVDHHRGFYLTKGVKNASKVAKATTDDGYRRTLPGEVTQGK
jgi:hypothetical protein